jgi:hypothetical protein
MTAKNLILDIRLAKIGPNIIAIIELGGITVRGSMAPAGVRFGGGVFPSSDDSEAELRAVQTLLYKLSRTDDGDKDVEEARLGLQLELSNTTLSEAMGENLSQRVSFELPATDVAPAGEPTSPADDDAG